MHNLTPINKKKWLNMLWPELLQLRGWSSFRGHTKEPNIQTSRHVDLQIRAASICQLIPAQFGVWTSLDSQNITTFFDLYQIMSGRVRAESSGKKERKQRTQMQSRKKKVFETFFEQSLRFCQFSPVTVPVHCRHGMWKRMDCQVWRMKKVECWVWGGM